MTPLIASYQTTLPYHPDPLALYHVLTDQHPNTLLYESADIDHQRALKSMMIVDASLRITAKGERVMIEALSESGQGMLSTIAAKFSSQRVEEKMGSDAGVLHLQWSAAEIDRASPLDLLRMLQQWRSLDGAKDNPYTTFIGGLFGYDLVGLFRGITIPEKNRGDDLVVYFAQSMVVIDHQARRTHLQCNYLANHSSQVGVEQRFHTLREQIEAAERVRLPKENGGQIAPTISEDDPATFMAMVDELKTRIKGGEFAQIVPSRRFKIACQSPIHAYERLKHSHPSPYLFYLNDADFTLLGASPESALKYNHTTRELELYPIAGTKPRGRNEAGEIDPILDLAMEEELKSDPKEVAEHLMLVDLAEEDLSPISVAGSFTIREKMKIDRYAYVMHLVSRVTSTLKPELDALDAYVATMNMGTLTGSPKDHAMETIYHYEQEARGSYGGGIGYLNRFGDLDSCIVIRSAFVKEGMATVQAGAGIVADSVAEKELEETRNKANAVIRAIVGR